MSNLHKQAKANNRIERYVFEGEVNAWIMRKSNLLLSFEMNKVEVSESDQALSQLTKMEFMILQTAFLMAHELNLKNPKGYYDAETEFVFSLEQFISLWGLGEETESKDAHSFNIVIRRAIGRLDKRRFYYKALNEKSENISSASTVLSGYFSSIKFSSLKNGPYFTFTFPKEFIPYLKNFGQFTWYYFSYSRILVDYPMAACLYEQFCRHKNNTALKKNRNQILISFEIDELRKILFTTEKYPVPSDFFRYLVNPAIKIINTKTSIVVEEHKKVINGSRELAAVSYLVTFSDDDLDFNLALNSAREQKPLLTNNQISKYAIKLVENEEFKYLFKDDAEDEMEFFKRISNELKQNALIVKYYPFMKKCGFSSVKVKNYIEGGKKP